MKKRLMTGLGIIAVLIIVLFARQASIYIFDAFIVLLAVLASIEMSKLLARNNMYNNMYFAIAYPILSYGLFQLTVQTQMASYMIFVLQVALIVLMTGVLALVGMFSVKNTKNEIETRKLKLGVEKFSMFKSIHTMFAYFYPAVLMLFFVYLNNFTNMVYLIDSLNEHHMEISLFALVVAFIVPVLTDTFAYLTGSIIKGKKLCPKISPNKTISGAIGGLIWGTAAPVLLYLIFSAISEYNIAFELLNLQIWHFAILGFIASVLCQVGDIFESYLKRKAGVKDSGSILPGHGGILDRMDSHIFCAPIVFIFFIILL